MSYKTTIKCFSEKNTMSEYKNFRLYVDGIGYPNTGRYFETDHQLKGKRHIYALVRGDSNKKVCSFLNNEHLNECVNQSKDEIITYLEEMMLGAYNASASENTGEHSAAVIYVENGEIYAAGFGESCVYSFSDDLKTAEKFNTSENNIRAVHIGNVSQCNKYLLSVSPATETLPAAKLTRFFSDDTEKAIDMYDEVSETNSEEHLVTASVSFEKNVRTYDVKIVIACILILLLAVSGYFAAFTNLFGTRPDIEGTGKSEIESGLSDGTSVIEDGSLDADESDELENSGIEAELDKIAFEISGENSKVSYYIKNLLTGDTLSKNSSQMYSANTVNMYAMAEIYRQLQNGELAGSPSLDALMESAITLNDPAAANELIKTAGGSDINLGFERITKYASDIGCTNTVLRTPLQSPDEVCAPEGNMTSVEDCALLLEKIYNGTLVSVESSGEMYDFMAKSTPENKILKYIPVDTAYAINKTGESVNVQNDAAIIYTDKCDYVFCVMVSDYTNTSDSASEVIARMSKVVYDFFTEAEALSDMQ